MFKINKKKIQTENWVIRLFNDEVYIAGKDIQMNTLIEDGTIEDHGKYFVWLICNKTFVFAYESLFDPYTWYVVAHKGIHVTNPTKTHTITYSKEYLAGVKIIEILFKCDDYWKVRKWFMKLYNEVYEES
jgi:hypothetical protein